MGVQNLQFGPQQVLGVKLAGCSPLCQALVLIGTLAQQVQTEADAAVLQLCAVSNESVQWQRAISTG